MTSFLDFEKPIAALESRILELTLRLNQLQSLVPLVEGDRSAGVLQEQQALIRDQESIIRGQEAKLLAASEQLQQRDTRIIERHWKAMARWIEHCKKDSKGLIRPAQGFGDWLSIKRCGYSSR